MSRHKDNSSITLSEAIKKTTNEMLFAALLNDPEKRAQVRDLLAQEGLVSHKENTPPHVNKTPIREKKNARPNGDLKFESPSALGRRRALQRLHSDSSTDDPPNVGFVGKPKPFETILEGLVIYCEIRSNGEDRSEGIKTILRAMGATVKENLCKSVTHVIFKDGLYTTYRKAKILKVHIVSILWLDSVRKHSFLVPESKFPAVADKACDADISKLCQDIQNEYNEIVEEELNTINDSNLKRLSSTPSSTLKRQSTKSKSSTDINVKEPHNRTEIATPYKYRCTTPALSESDSCISVGSNVSKSFDSKILSIITEDESHENHANLKKIKDSFELKKVEKIRSPNRLSSSQEQNNSDKEKSNESDSIRLEITDESNLSENVSKCNVQNDNTSKNLEENSANANKNNENNDCKETRFRAGSSASINNSDLDINKNKSRRKTIGLKRPAKTINNEENKLNKTINTTSKTPRRKTIANDIQSEPKKRKALCLSPNKEVDKLNKTTFKTPKRKTVVNENNTSENENPSETKRRRQTISTPSKEKINSIETRNVTVRRKALAKPDEEKQVSAKQTSSDLSGEKAKRKARKLFDPNKYIGDLEINWENEAKLEEAPAPSVSPTKKVKYQDLTELVPKVFSSKAEKKLKSITRASTSKKQTINREDIKEKRKSVRTLTFSSSESDLEGKKDVKIRKSERIAKTPSKNLNESCNNIPEKNENNFLESNIITKRERKSRVVISSVETDSNSENEFNALKTPIRLKSQNTKSPKESSTEYETTEESKRRSTLDFVPERSKKSLEQIRLTQKQNRPMKVTSIVCTRLHKSEVQVFQQIVKKLGGFIVEDEVTKRTTHVVAKGPARTINMLRAIVRGCWILRQEWLFRSLEAGKWLEEEDFEMTEFSPAVQKCRIEKQSFGPLYSMDLFKNCGPIFISRQSVPRFSDLEELVQLCGGRIVSRVEDAQIIIGEEILQEGVSCVTEKWILDSITENKKKKSKNYLLRL